MSTSPTVARYLHNRRVAFAEVQHDHAATSMQAAEAAHIPGMHLVKGVVIEDRDQYWLVIVPATSHVDLAAVSNALGRSCGLATEEEVRGIFADCAPGSVPPLGPPYGIGALVDAEVLRLPDVYLASGDPTILLHLNGPDFADIVGAAEAGEFAEVW